MALGGGRPDRASRAALPIFGVRQLAQAPAEARWSEPVMRRAGVTTDALHGVTAAVLAAVDRRQRRAAAADAVVPWWWAARGAAGLRAAGRLTR